MPRNKFNIITLTIVFLTACTDSRTQSNMSRITGEQSLFERGRVEGYVEFINAIDNYDPGSLGGHFIFSENEKKDPYIQGVMAGFLEAKTRADSKFIPVFVKLDKIHNDILTIIVNKEDLTIDQLNKIFNRE